MIISKSPLRLSLGGGGTDLPSYYKIRGGRLIAGAIDKHVYISIAETFNKRFILKYSKHENIDRIKDIKHPIFREALKYLKIKRPLNISSHADIPAGTGLGSSGSFTVSLLAALTEYNNLKIFRGKIAEQACKIEINKLQEPVGKQDQYMASFGGINELIFLKSGKVIVNKIQIKDLKKFKKNLAIFFTGYTRNASKILSIQNKKTKLLDKLMIKNLDEVKEIGINSKKALINGNFEEYGEILNSHWKIKKKRSANMSNKRINYLYDLALDNGAIGGKLIGAGGGGFLMFYVKNNHNLKNEMIKKGLTNLNFNFDFEGVKII